MERSGQRISHKTVKIKGSFSAELDKHVAKQILDGSTGNGKYRSPSSEIITLKGNHLKAKSKPKSRDTSSCESQPEDTTCNTRNRKQQVSKKGKNLRVSFIDQVTTAPIADIIEVESYARYNVPDLDERPS